MNRDWICLSFIGDGAYSEVYKVKRLSDNQIYALKKVSGADLNNVKISRENVLDSWSAQT